MSTKSSRIGTYSFGGLVGLFFWMTLLNGVNYLDLLRNILAFLSGGYHQVPNGRSEAVLTTLMNSSAIMLIIIVVALACGYIVKLLVGAPSSFVHEQLDQMLDKGPTLLFLTVLMEEVLARWLFLGLIASWFNSSTAFYVLMLLGNSAWAVVHLVNYKNKEEWSLLRVVPQFIGGLILSYIYLRYGFFVTLMVHFLYNVVILSTLKEQPVTSKDWKVATYWTVLGVISYLIMKGRGLEFSMLAQWVQSENGIRPIENFSFWDYAVLLIVIDCIAGFIGAVLLLDYSEVTADHVNPTYLILGIPVTIAIIMLINWITSFLFPDALTRAIAVTLIIALMSRTQSGSALARAFLVNLPGTFLAVAAFTTLGIWTATGLTLIFTVVSYLPLLFELHEQTAHKRTLTS